MKEGFLVVLGWVLGIASTFGLDRYKERRRRQRFIAGLRIEFGRLQAGMAILFWNFKDRDGTGTRDDIEWVLSNTRHAPGDEGVLRFRTNFAKARARCDMACFCDGRISPNVTL